MPDNHRLELSGIALSKKILLRNWKFRRAGKSNWSFSDKD
jgi:hypothetical protein